MVHCPGKLAHCLGHESCLQTNRSIPHFSIEFCLWYKGCYRVDDHKVNRTRLDEHFTDFKCLFTRVWLREDEFVNIYAKGFGILRVDGIFGIDECTSSTCLLTFRNGMQCKGCLTGRFRSIDFDDSSFWITTNTKCCIQCNRTRRDGIYRNVGTVAKSHDGTFAIFLFNCFECFIEQLIFPFSGNIMVFFFFRHTVYLLYI